MGVSGVSQREHRLGGVKEGVVLPSFLSTIWSALMASSSPCSADFIHHSRAVIIFFGITLHLITAPLFVTR